MADSAPSRLRLAVIGAGLGSAPHFRSLDDLASEAEVAWVFAIMTSSKRGASVALPPTAMIP
ncbi:MAG: hypothetical protein ABI845_09905 [Polaromonas sp.]